MSGIGDRVEIAPHYDLWMRGARFGVIIAWRKRGGETQYKVKLDRFKNPQWFLDVTFI